LCEDLPLYGNFIHEREGLMPASICRNSEGRAEVLRLYDEALFHLGIGHESKTISTRYGETHILSLGPEDAPPVLFLHADNFLNPTCLRWFLAIGQRYRIHSSDIVDSRARARSLSLQVVASELMSLDRVMEKPEEWSFSYSNDEMKEANASEMASSDAMLLGRVTYEEFAAFWPYQDRTEQPYTDYLNNTPKYVVSRTLDEPLEWQNSTLIKGNVAEEVSRLKEQPGKDITIVGSGALVRSLLREGLLDELSLMVHPIVLGRGKRLFEEGGDQKALELVDSQTFTTGVLYLTY
jgi:dihydrofolate reductase